MFAVTARFEVIWILVSTEYLQLLNYHVLACIEIEESTWHLRSREVMGSNETDGTDGTATS